MDACPNFISGPLKKIKGILFHLGIYSTLFMGCEWIKGDLYCVNINLVPPTVEKLSCLHFTFRFEKNTLYSL